jgi:cyclophilin family peptidyl-prolyl cis-trans isomerase
VSITLHTSQGDIPLTMPRAEAPCTVASFVFLAQKGYFNQTPCHRLTAADSLKVLQCGDPTGTGTGGPGYTIPDENPTNLPPAPGAQGASLYARGTVAMANTGQPHSGGSQFFLVYANSELPPSYAVRPGLHRRSRGVGQDREGRRRSGRRPDGRRTGGQGDHHIGHCRRLKASSNPNSGCIRLPRRTTIRSDRARKMTGPGVQEMPITAPPAISVGGGMCGYWLG